MTRNEMDAIDEMQRKQGMACENLLADSAWNRAQTITKAGLMQRLTMIPAAGLPRMRVLSQSTLKRLGRIPRSHESYQEDAYQAVRRCGDGEFNRPKAVILFYTHRWKRPNWCEELQKELPWESDERQQAMKEGKIFGDPDDASHSKARSLIAYGDWFKQRQVWLGREGVHGHTGMVTRDRGLEIFWWVDWACTDQNALGPDMAALPAYAAACAGAVAAWSPDYASRAWCQVELLMAYAFMQTGSVVFVVPEGFAGAKPQGTRGDKWVKEEEVVLADPAKGNLTNDNDRPVIQSLTGVAKRSTAYSCWRVFVKHSTQSVDHFCFWNVCCCCGWCGIKACDDSRKVHPGDSIVRKLLPVGETLAAPSQQAMQR